MDTAEAERLVRMIRPRLARMYRELAELRRLVAQLAETIADETEEDTNGDHADTVALKRELAARR